MTLAAAALLSACDANRQNTFIAPIFGAEPERSTPTADAPESASIADGQIDTAALDTARRAANRQSPIIRQPGVADEAMRVQIREPIRISADGTVTMNFERIGVADFSRAVFGEILGLDYTVNPAISGAVSLQVSRPVPRESVYPIAERALAAVGVAVRRDGDLVVIEPDPRGPESGPPASLMIVRRLGHVDRAQMEQALQSFVAPDARVTQGPTPDSLILAGSEDGVGALNSLIDALDIDPLASRSFALFPLSVSAAAQVADELREILGTGAPTDPKVVEIERMNAVLVITDSRAAIDEAQFWVRRLDQNDAVGTQIHVYQVQNRRAKDLAELLQQGVARGEITGLAEMAPSVAPGLTEVTVGQEGAAPQPASLRPMRERRSGGGQLDEVTIFADEGTNSIMTIATPERYALIEVALRRLDIQPVQVLIEATIIEVTLKDELRYGVRWFFESGSLSGGLAKELSDVATDAGFNFVVKTSNIRAVINALDSVTDVEVVSSPSLMVLNNETARLQVGQEVPIATAAAETLNPPTSDNSATFVVRNEIQYRDTGVILEITPRVNASGVVQLDVVQEVSSVAEEQTSGIDSPTLSQRRFESSVILRDRSTIALGGLIQTNRTSGKNGIPLLSDIPVVGALFGETGQTANRTELLMLIRPIVVRNHAEARAAYEELRAKLHGLDDLHEYLPAN